MIAIDTNVLLRYLLADDAAQHRKAKALIETQRPALIKAVAQLGGAKAPGPALKVHK